MTRKEKSERAEQKKEVIRKELFKILLECEKLKNLDPTTTINKAIDMMKAKNPQESHFVKSVCLEIRVDNAKWIQMMIKKYGLEGKTA